MIYACAYINAPSQTHIYTLQCDRTKSRHLDRYQTKKLIPDKSVESTKSRLYGHKRVRRFKTIVKLDNYISHKTLPELSTLEG